MTFDDEEQAKETAGIQIDQWGIKAKVVPSDGELPPRTWRETARAVNQHLMRIASSLTAFPAEVFEGANRLLRGITAFPGALSKRVAGAHQQAEEVESKRQRAIQKHSGRPQQTADEARARAEALLEDLRARGFHVAVRQEKSGNISITVVRPELAEQAAALAATASKKVPLLADEIDFSDLHVYVSGHGIEGSGAMVPLPPTSSEES